MKRLIEGTLKRKLLDERDRRRALAMLERFGLERVYGVKSEQGEWQFVIDAVSAHALAKEIIAKRDDHLLYCDVFYWEHLNDRGEGESFAGEERRRGRGGAMRAGGRGATSDADGIDEYLRRRWNKRNAENGGVA